MSNPIIVNAYAGSGTLSPSGSITVDVSVTAPVDGDYFLIFITAPSGISISPSLTGVSSWSELASVTNGGNVSSVWGGSVGAGGGTTLAVAFSGGAEGDAVIVQCVEVTTEDAFIFDGSPATMAQAVQTGTSFTGNSPSFEANFAGDLLLAYLSCVSLGEGEGLGAGPTHSFTSVNTAALAGPNGNLLAQLASLQVSSPGSYSTSQGFTQAVGIFDNYCQSIVLAIAPLLAPSTVFPSTQMRFLPSLGHSNL